MEGLRLVVNGARLSVYQDTLVTSNGDNQFDCTVTLDKWWNDKAIQVLFDDEVCPVIGGKARIPSAVLDKATFTVAVVGLSETERYTTNIVTVKIAPGKGIPNSSPVPTPDIWTQYITAVDALARQSALAAQRAEDASGNAPYIGETDTWWTWDMTLGQFVDSGISATAAIVQETGDSAYAAMSQRSTTLELQHLDKKVADIVTEQGVGVNEYYDTGRYSGDTTGWQYLTSTFTGWSVYIGSPAYIGGVEFTIRNRPTATQQLRSITVEVLDEDTQEIVQSKTLSVNLAPGEAYHAQVFLPKQIDNFEGRAYRVQYYTDIESDSIGRLCRGNLTYPVKYTTTSSSGTRWSVITGTEAVEKDFNVTYFQVFSVIKKYVISPAFHTEILTAAAGATEPLEKRLAYFSLPDKTFGFSGFLKEDIQKTAQMGSVSIVLPPKIYAVVGDTLQLFHRGMVKAFDLSNLAVNVLCAKGSLYPRYFEYTPHPDDVGEYPLTVQTRLTDGTITATGTTTLVVVPAMKERTAPEQYSLLVFGDSLTSAGHWAAEGLRRIFGTDADILPTPTANPNLSIYTYGSKTNTINGYEIHHEGYGGWTWGSFQTDARSPTSTTNGILVTTTTPLNQAIDTVQKSQWQDENDRLWELEDYQDANTITFNRGDGNDTIQSEVPLPTTLTCDTLGLTITVQTAHWQSVNPFWNEETDEVDFLRHATEHGQNDAPDLAACLLTWNGGGGMNSQGLDGFDFSGKINTHMENARALLLRLKQQRPTVHVFVMGIPLNSITGGCGTNYGATGSYSDPWSTLMYAFDYNKALCDLMQEPEFSIFCEYVDTKSQFDAQYNMPYIKKQVNTRNKNELELLGTNGVHPSAEGYNQIGDAFYRALLGYLNGTRE